MAGSVNKVILVGNLGQKPEVKFLPSGQAVCEMRIATNEVFNDKNQQRQERTEWHDVVLFGKRAEALSKFLRKGASLLVEGRLETQSYEDREGAKKYRTKVIAQNIVLGPRGVGARDTSTTGETGSGDGRAAVHTEPEGNDPDDSEIPF